MTDDKGDRKILVWDHNGRVMQAELPEGSILMPLNSLRWLIDYSGERTLQQQFQSSIGRIWLPVKEVYGD